MDSGFSPERSQEVADQLDLLVVDGVAHPWIDPFRHCPPQLPEDPGAFLHPLDRDVGVDVAAAEEDRGPLEAGGVGARGLGPSATT